MFWLEVVGSEISDWKCKIVREVVFRKKGENTRGCHNLNRLSVSSRRVAKERKAKSGIVKYYIYEVRAITSCTRR